MINIKIVKDTPEEYHAKPFLSKSYMDYFIKCPALFQWKMQHAEVSDSDALLHGSLFHAALLEPSEVNKRYARKMYNGTTKEGKAEKAAAIEKGITLVKPEIYDSALGMAETVFNHPFWQRATHGQRTEIDSEISVYWEQNGWPCKARIDLVSEIDGIGRCIIDLKSTQDASPAGIRKSMAKYGYHRQAAWYRHALSLAGKPTEGFVLVFCEKTAPYLTTIAVVSEDAQKQALNEIREAMEKIKICQESGNWPTYTEGVIDLDLPDWYYKEVENHE